MYKVLIVDDEKIERDGIKLLIDKFKLELHVAEAENGRKAIEYIKANPVDILITDIKMPFMSGLELAESARTLDQNLKIIIYSAFGEFEYAQKAINIKVEHYILKPINKMEFFRVVTQVLEDCRKEEEESQRSKKIMELYQKGAQHEKEKVLLDIINGSEFNEDLQRRIEMANLNVLGNYIRMMLIDFRSRFYDIYDKNIKTIIEDNIEFQHEYLNLNERQSLVFIISQNKLPDRDYFKVVGKRLIEEIQKRYCLISTVVFSDMFDNLKYMELEMDKIEQVLDCKFFHDESLVLFTCMEDPKDSTALPIDSIVEKIYKGIDSANWIYVENEIGNFFKYLKGAENYSTIYVKYVCAEFVKKIFSKVDKCEEKTYKTAIESIFKSENLEQLRDITNKIIREPGKHHSENKKTNTKAIRDTLEYIKEHYMEDISIECLAEREYLTPNYLNLIFKKEIGQSLGKYITNYRLNKAGELLRNTNMKIIDIGESVGYTNNSYFCLLFKNYYGVTPIKYREMG